MTLLLWVAVSGFGMGMLVAAVGRVIGSGRG